jgi:hypothetical protein
MRIFLLIILKNIAKKTVFLLLKKKNDANSPFRYFG